LGERDETIRNYMTDISTLMDQIIALAQQAKGGIVIPPSSPTLIETPDAFDRALSTAVPHAVLLLSQSFVYPSPLTIRRPVTISSGVIPIARMVADLPLPRFTGGVTIPSDGVGMIGVEVRHPNPLTDIMSFSGANTLLDRLRVLGDPNKGAKRGIAANGGGGCQITRCHIDDCFATYPGSDSQAIISWDMLPGLLIEDNFLQAGSETFMLGGADSTSAERMPADVIIRKNTITKNPAWQPLPIGVKNTLELKVGRNILIEDNDISQSWGGHGQDGYIFAITVRNQGGKAPWSTLENVTIQNNRCANAAAVLIYLGTDNLQPSGTVKGFAFKGNAVTGIDPVKYTGSAKMMQFGGGGTGISLASNTFAGVPMSSVIYFYGSSTYEMDAIGNTWMKSKYGVFGEGSAVGKPGQIPPAWTRYVTKGTFSGNVESVV
jgi:hypothetical protein